MTPRAAVALLGLYLRVREVFANWNGAAGIRCEGNDTEIGIERLFEEVVVPACGVAARLDPLLGGYGSARLVLSVAATINRSIERDLDTVDADDEVVESLKREVLRSMGYSAWEPEPDEPATAGESVTAT
jgi:hypothetical protein